MKLRYAFFVFVLLSNVALAQVKKLTKPTPRRTTTRAVPPNSAISDTVSRADTTKPADPFSGGNPATLKPGELNKGAGGADSATARGPSPKPANKSPRPTLQPDFSSVPGTAKTPVRRYRRGYDAIVTYDFCAGEDQDAIVLSSKGVTQLFLKQEPRIARKWLYLKATDNARMIVTGVNTANYTLVLNTIGLVAKFDTANWKTQLANLSNPSTKSTAGAVKDSTAPPPSMTADEIRELIAKNNTTLVAYTEALRDARRLLAAQQCLSKGEIEAYLKATVPGSTLSRTELVASQRQLLAQLPKPEDDALKQETEAVINPLDSELVQWGLLRAGTELVGPVIPARDMDFVRFKLTKRFAGGAETVLPVIDVPVYGNFRINVSTGLLVNRLMDHTYLAIDEKVYSGTATAALANTSSETTTTTSTTTTATSTTAATGQKVPVLDDAGKATIGVGALIHCYFTTRFLKGNLTPALTIGASLNSSGRYTVMVGGSLIVGSSQRVVLTAGYAVGPVSRLQQPFKEGKPYEYSGAQFPTTTRTLGDWFFGLTWNLSSSRNPVSTN